MLEDLGDHTRGKTRNIRRSQGGGMLKYIIVGVVAAALLGALVLVAGGLQRTRSELADMRGVLHQLQNTPVNVKHGAQSGTAGAQEIAALRKSLASMRTEVLDSVDETAREIRATGLDAASDRKTLKLNVARILFRQGVSRDEVFPLTVGLSSKERNEFLDELEAAEKGELPAEETSGAVQAGDSGVLPENLAATAPPPEIPGDTEAASPLPLPTPSGENSALPTPSGGNSTPPEPAGKPVTIYTVKAGDTVWGISEQFGVSYNTLLKENKIRNARKVQVGTKLRIPGK